MSHRSALPEDRLTELFAESVAAAQEITEALGTQVRRAVELLVQALSEAALRTVPDPLPAKRGDVYEAAVTRHDAGGPYSPPSVTMTTCGDLDMALTQVATDLGGQRRSVARRFPLPAVMERLVALQ